MNNNETDKLRKKCWDNAFYNFATAWIFEKRASKLKIKLKMLTFLGIVVPITVGGIIISFGVNFKYLNIILTLGGILSISQLIVSVWALVSKWDDEYAYSLESISSNYFLSNKYKELADNPPKEISEFNIKMSMLDLDNRNRSDSDCKHQIGEKEKRIGHRAALRQFQQECTGCKKIPTSMRSSDCNICGTF